MAVDAVLQQVDALTDDEKKIVHAAITQQLPPPSGWALSVAWTIVLSVLGLTALGALAAIFVLNYQNKAINDAIIAALTTCLGLLGGLLAPSPVAQNPNQQGG